MPRLRYSLRTLLILTAAIAIALPSALVLLRQRATAEISFDGVRTPTELLPDEHDESRAAVRPRLAFRAWFEKQGFVMEPASNTDHYSGRYENSLPLRVTVEFQNEYAYITVFQDATIYPWESRNPVALDDPGSRFAKRLDGWAQRYYQMEQAVRTFAGVEDSTWNFEKGTVFAPGVRYSPPMAPSKPEPLWAQGFRR